MMYSAGCCARLKEAVIFILRSNTAKRKDFETGAEESYGIGLEYGHKYDFTVTLNTLMDGEAGNAGEYNLINWYGRMRL